VTHPECDFRDSVSVLAPDPDIIPGGSFWLRQVDEKSATIVIITTNLPPPSSFDPTFTVYWYTVQEEITHMMGQVAPGVWWAYHSGTDVVVPFPPDASILIQPGTKCEPGYPIVLSGKVGGCMRAFGTTE